MNAIRAVAVLFGAVYVIAGLAGFLPAFVTDEAPPTMPSAEGNLLGIFPINTAHNLLARETPRAGPAQPEQPEDTPAEARKT